MPYTIKGFTTTKPLNEQLKDVKIKLPFAAKEVKTSVKPNAPFKDKDGKDLDVKSIKKKT